VSRALEDGTLQDGMARLSLNQATVQSWGAREAIEGCARHGIGFVGLWRDKVAEAGAAQVRSLLSDTGVRVSSLCRGGFFPAESALERAERLDDNRRAVDEAAEVGTDLLVLVCGGVVGRDLAASRRMVADGIAAVAPYAAERGVRLGIEPLHPMFAGDRSVICSLGQALEIAEGIDSPAVGVVVDVYHVWSDENVHGLLERAGPRIFGFHVNDWLAPPPDVLLGRGMMGDGEIDLKALWATTLRAGYRGPVEVEIFNRRIWDLPGDEVLELMRERYRTHVLGA
jgi:sugar phosphate isomerase/epimerase